MKRNVDLDYCQRPTPIDQQDLNNKNVWPVDQEESRVAESVEGLQAAQDRRSLQGRPDGLGDEGSWQGELVDVSVGSESRQAGLFQAVLHSRHGSS